MKALILTAAMLLLTAVLAPQASADKLIPLNGFLTGNEVSQFTNGAIVLDGTLSGKSSLGDVTYTYHAELDPIHLTAVQSGQLSFANGDMVNVEGFGLSVSSGLTKDASALGTVTELLHFTSGTGRFANGLGSFVVQRTQSVAIADYAHTSETFGSFQGSYLAGGGKGSSDLENDATTSENGGEKKTLNPDESVVQICDKGRERIIPASRAIDYVNRHPGSYLGPCDGGQF